MFANLEHWQASFSTVCLKHGLESGETRGLPVLLDRVDIISICYRLWGSSVAGGARLPVHHHSVLTGQSWGVWVNLLKPRGRETSQETIQHLGVHMAEESREVGQRWVLTKLPLGEVVEELLHHPIQDA